jgi:hypothetical protein
MGRKKRKALLNELKRIDIQHELRDLVIPPHVHELLDLTIPPDLTLNKWRELMQAENHQASVAGWFNACCVIDPSAVMPVGDGSYIQGLRLRTPEDTQPTIEEYLYEREKENLSNRQEL